VEIRKSILYGDDHGEGKEPKGKEITRILEVIRHRETCPCTAHAAGTGTAYNRPTLE
jgi:hypothetical protein